MTETVTITRHVAKPEYHWEIVIPGGSTTLLAADRLEKALELLGLTEGDERRQEILALGDGESRGIDADLNDTQRNELLSLGKKKKDVGERAREASTL